MKKPILHLLAAVILGILTGCGETSNMTAPTPDPEAQPEAQTALFQRSYDRARSLIEAKDYDQARRTLEMFKQYKLTPEQQQLVDKLQAQIPAN